MANLWLWGVDYQNQPLYDPYWTPGWTSQNDSYVQVPNLGFNAPGFPVDLNYVLITGSYFDTSGNPLSGYLTFFPSSPLTFTIDGNTTYIPQRYAGLNFSLIGINQMGDGKIYLQYGRLLVSVMATDNANMTPTSFTYHVKEHYPDGLQYDITAPSADDGSSVDLHSLIIPGSIRPVDDDEYSENNVPRLNIPVTSTQYVVTLVKPQMLGGTVFNPGIYPVNFAFIAGSSLPQDSDWISGEWAQATTNYLAQILVGPDGHTLSQGTYRVWVQIVTDTQIPVFPVGYLNIY